MSPAVPIASGPLPPLPEPVPGAGPLSARVIGEQGPVIVLVHGLGRAAAGWTLVARALGPGFRLVLPDNPGLGRSGALPVPRTIEESARLHRDTLESLGLDPPYHVAGLSLGGMIAPVLAADLGPRCASLAMFSASSRETGFWRLSPGSLLRMAGRVILTLGIDHRVNMPELVRPSLLLEHPEMVPAIDALQAAEGFDPRNGIRQLFAAMRFRIRPHLARLPARKLVIVGSRDRLVPPSNSRRLAELTGAPLLVLPGAAHDLGFDAPEDVARVLRAMASGRDPAEIAAGWGS